MLCNCAADSEGVAVMPLTPTGHFDTAVDCVVAAAAHAAAALPAD